MKKTYKINEIFYSIQGEGAKTGTACVFVRFSGCNLRCPFCDTKHYEGDMFTSNEIVEQISQYRCDWVVLTGGEPTLFADNELALKIHAAGYKIAVETNGTNNLNFDADWVTVSPKDQFVENATLRLTEANELKVVYTGKNNILAYTDKVKVQEKYIQPCDTGDKAENKCLIEACVDFVKKHTDWKISLQTQKILDVR